MGGVVFNLVAGRMLDSGLGYGAVFGIVGTFHVHRVHPHPAARIRSRIRGRSRVTA